MKAATGMLAAVLLASAGSGALAGPKAVVELFTSQGCSSCPPADRLLGELAQDDGLLALTLPVTIWDRLGWKDTLASPALTLRQQAYTRVRHERTIYTPQAVVSGRDAVVGSNPTAIARAIRDLPPLPLDVTLAAADGAMRVAVDGEGASGAVLLVLYEPTVTVPIGRGENGGATITYHNVVREMRNVGTFAAAPLRLEVPLPADRGLRVAVLVQAQTPDGPGPILGAARLDKAL